MWLLPASSLLARLAIRVFYRFSCSGQPPAGSGPVLLVANHPNSLVDAIVVSAVAKRPVRYLAKAPLFELARLGWLLRAVGAIPIYRRVDDPSAVDQNVHAFAAVFDALRDGAVIGIFPEGISHSEPELAPVKTGAARIALGFAKKGDRALSVVPVGLVLRDKARFRSEAAAFFGPPVAWDDLAERGDQDRDAVRELTARIDRALRSVTVNLERWEDEPLVRCAEEIWQAENEGEDEPEARLARINAATDALAALRRRGDESWSALARSVDLHRRRLERLRLTPVTLRSKTDILTALQWTLRRLHVLAPLALLVATAGAALYWPAYRLTGLATRLAPPLEDVQATYKLLVGMALYPAWTLLVGVAIWAWRGPPAAALALVALPIVGITGLWTRERWRGAWADARRFFTLRSRRGLVASLRSRQEQLAGDLERPLDEWRAETETPSSSDT